MPNLDNINFSALLNLSKEHLAVEIGTEEFLFSELGINISDFSPEKQQQLLRNYLYIVSLINNDLNEIDNRLDEITKQLQTLPKGEEYQRKRLEYFKHMNTSAKNEIVKFFHNKLKDFLLEYEKSDLISRTANTDKLISLFIQGRYDYAFFKNFYDPNYDFSTDVKVRYLPQEPFAEFQSRIEKYINLKKTSSPDYFAAIESLVTNKNLVVNMNERVKNNYHLHKRTEIFEILTQLYQKEKYQTFITLATLQIEGIFYDLCLIKYGETKNMGTLVEKVQKAFQDNPKLWKPLYPYFAFDVPNLRNEIAHNGMVKGRNLKTTAYEIILDLNCVISCVESESIDKFKVFMLIGEKLNNVDSDACTDQEEYDERVAQTLLGELFQWNDLTQDYFWDVLKNPNDFQVEINFYKPDGPKEYGIYLTDVVSAIEQWTKSEKFWCVVYNNVKNLKSDDFKEPSRFVKFAMKLTNTFIPLLSGVAKDECIEVSKALAKYNQ